MMPVLRFAFATLSLAATTAFAQYVPNGNYAVTPYGYGQPMYPGTVPTGPIPLTPNGYQYGYGNPGYPPVQAPYGQPSYQGQVTPYGQPCVQGQPYARPGYVGPQGPCLQPGYNGNLNDGQPYVQPPYGSSQPTYEGGYEDEEGQLPPQDEAPNYGRRPAPQAPVVRGPRGH